MRNNSYLTPLLKAPERSVRNNSYLTPLLKTPERSVRTIVTKYIILKSMYNSEE